MRRVRSFTPSPRPLLAAAAGSLALFAGLAVVVTRDGFSRVDQAARALVQGSTDSLMHGAMHAVSFLGGEAGQVPVILIGSVVLWRRRRRWSVALPLVMAGAGLVQLAAKWGFDRPRPNLDPWGFPSAHVLSLVVLLGCVAYLLAVSGSRRRWRALAVASCPAAVATVAYSRMFLDVHWLSDVLGGLAIGLAYLFGVIWFMHGTTVVATPLLSEPEGEAGGDEGT
jgi:undecaprenyl-diphosphatase